MSNPVFGEGVYRNQAGAGSFGFTQSDVMTVEGASTKTVILLAIAATTGIITWNFMGQQHPLTMPFVIGGAIGGLIMALVTSFKPTWSPVTAPIYAALEGLFLGGISAMFENAYNGIVLQAVCLTLGVVFLMMIAFRTGFIQPTERLKAGIFAAVGAIMLIYLASFALSFVGIQIPYIHGSGPIGILFSVIVVCVASLMLILDFDFIVKGAEYGAPKYMEWYGAFGLMVTIVWLYLEILKLLAKLQADD